MLLGNLIKFAYLIINKHVSILIVSKLFIYLIPYLFVYSIPIAVVVGVLFCLGRASNDNEIIAIRASGVNLFFIFSPLIVLGIILSLTLVIFNDQLIPKAHFATRRTLVDLGVKNPTAALDAGTFIESFQKYILFIYKIEENKLYNIRIIEPQGPDKPNRIIVAQKGEFISYPEKGMVKLKLIDGSSDEVDPRNPNNFYKLYFKTYFMTLNLSQEKSSQQINKKPKDMTIRELKDKINKYNQEKIDPLPYLVQFHEKFAISFSPLIFILLGIPLGVATNKREKKNKIKFVFLFVMLYYLSFIGLEALSMQGLINVNFMWLTNLVFAAIGLTSLYRTCAY